MQILNLINLEKSDIKYHISKFPDGEVQITLGNFSRKECIQVICRITSAEELFIVCQVIDILNRHEVDYNLAITYLMGMRMDRVMDFNRPFTLKVVANMLIDTPRISLLESHSNTIRRFLDVNNYSYNWETYLKGHQLVFPDSGAKKRYSKLIRDASDKVITCSKVRDLETGRILSINIDNPEDLDGRPLMILDDLCDGGGTFCGIAESLSKVGVSKSNLNIIVTHMVNPRGIENLSKNFNHVWFTNSYKDWQDLPENVTMVKVI